MCSYQWILKKRIPTKRLLFYICTRQLLLFPTMKRNRQCGISCDIMTQTKVQKLQHSTVYLSFYTKSRKRVCISEGDKLHHILPDRCWFTETDFQKGICKETHRIEYFKHPIQKASAIPVGVKKKKKKKLQSCVSNHIQEDIKVTG